MMFALVLTNGASVAAAVCQHADARAHSSALYSGVEGVARQARNEETAAKRIAQKGTLADAAAVQLAGFMLPVEPRLSPPEASDDMGSRPLDEAKMATRELSPLLEPPLV
jgi:hypothetical protein